MCVSGVFGERPQGRAADLSLILQPALEALITAASPRVQFPVLVKSWVSVESSGM